MKKTAIYSKKLFHMILLALVVANKLGFGQENIALRLTKPRLYENRKLPSENNTYEKIGFTKKIKQNIVSHYNFHFNANNKLNAVLENAKRSYKDSFDRLITISDFSLEQTLGMQNELDSVIIKCNNGILLHDLRNDWIDDLYFLMAKAYFYEKKFDSAYDVFQYINYNFQPREKNEIGFEKTIGSNINNSGNIYTISSKEKKGLINSFKHPTVRNEALIWIGYTLMKMDNDDEAKSMFDLLSGDNNFPERLLPMLAEKKAEWFLKKEQYDSAAYYLEKSLPVCNNNKEKSRRYFLIAQLYAIGKHSEMAVRFFEKSISNTTDPLMEAHARIQQITGSGDMANENKRIDENIQALLKLLDKETYQNFKPIIFSSIATLELKRNNTKAAIEYLKKSNQNNLDDQMLKTGNFIKIAKLAFALKKYSIAKTYLDSVEENSLNKEIELLTLKPVVNELVKNLDIIQLEDSLQQLARMSEVDRIKTLSAILKNKKTILDSEQKGKNAGIISSSKNNLLEKTSGTLFPTESQKGEWYFNNPSLLVQGKIEFKNKWGDRPNVDNWRRSSSFNALNKPQVGKNEIQAENEFSNFDSAEISMESLLAPIPLTPEKIIESNLKKVEAYRRLGEIYKNKLDNCKESIYWNERLITESTADSYLEQKYFDLSYCYKKEGNTEKSKYYQDVLSSTFPESKLNQMLKDPLALQKIEKEKELEATRKYEEIYNMFISGKFDNALKNKKIADSIYGQSKWSPQLLYIESLYYINKRDDSTAIETLGKITLLYPNSPLSRQALLVTSILKKRAEIEKELTEKSIERERDTPIEWIDDSPLSRTKVSNVVIDTIAQDKEPIKIAQNRKLDSSNIKSIKNIITDEKYALDLNESQYVLLLLNDVDIIYSNEAKRAITNYNNRNFTGKSLGIQQEKIDEKTIFKISEFKNIVEAMDYIELAKKVAPSEIFPWLPVQKYSFLLISASNFKILMKEDKLLPYLNFIKIALPGKF